MVQVLPAVSRPASVAGQSVTSLSCVMVEPSATVRMDLDAESRSGCVCSAARTAPSATARWRGCTSCCCGPRASRSSAAARIHTAARRPRRLRPAGRRRRARGDSRQAGRLPRRQPLHDVGLQVRAARGGREAAPAAPGRARAAARGRGARARAARALARGRAPRRASCSAAVRARSSRSSAHAPARGARRGDAQRRPDRRARGAAPQTRGAIYKSLHDARAKLRRRLAADGFDTGLARGGSEMSEGDGDRRC